MFEPLKFDYIIQMNAEINLCVTVLSGTYYFINAWNDTGNSLNWMKMVKFLFLFLVFPMLPLMIYGTTSRQAFSRQLRRCVTQQGPIVGIVKPGGGMNMWERSLLPSGKLSRHGRLVKALKHHTMQPNALPDV